MNKTIVNRPQSYSYAVLKRLLIPILAILIVITELIEFVDGLFFLETDTWQMRVFFYTGYLVVAPVVVITMLVLLF